MEHSLFKLKCRLGELLDEKGFRSQYEASVACGIHKNVIHRLVTHKTAGIDFDTMLRLCIGLKCTPNELFVIDPIDD